MELEELLLQLSGDERSLAEAFKTYMLTASALAEYGYKNGVSVSSPADEEERLSALLKSTDSYLRPYMEEFVNTLFSLSAAFRSEIIDDMDE
ncbi:MAG: hypothetical protein PUA83_07625 [Clostridiales bacterium]|nr:hypothetical protein [Clostridiales bacterium]